MTEADPNALIEVDGVLWNEMTYLMRQCLALDCTRVSTTPDNYYCPVHQKGRGGKWLT